MIISCCIKKISLICLDSIEINYFYTKTNIAQKILNFLNHPKIPIMKNCFSSGFLKIFFAVKIFLAKVNDIGNEF